MAIQSIGMQLRVDGGFNKTKISNSFITYTTPNHYFAGGTILQDNYAYAQNDRYNSL